MVNKVAMVLDSTTRNVQKIGTTQHTASEYYGEIIQSPALNFTSVDEQYKHMQVAVRAGVIHNYLSRIETINNKPLTTDLFPIQSLEAYTRYNLGEPQKPGDDTLFNAHRGGLQGDYRAGIQKKLTQVVESLSGDNKNSQAFLVIPNQLSPAPDDDGNAKCLQLMNFWVREGDNGVSYVDTAVNFRSQAVEIFPKNIHFTSSIINKICNELQNHLIDQLDTVRILPGEIFYQAGFLTNTRLQDGPARYLLSTPTVKRFTFPIDAAAHLKNCADLNPLVPVYVNCSINPVVLDALLTKKTDCLHQHIAPTEDSQIQLKTDINRIVAALIDRPHSKRAYLFFPFNLSSIESYRDATEVKKSSGAQLVQFQAIPQYVEESQYSEKLTNAPQQCIQSWRLNATVIARGEDALSAERTLEDISTLVRIVTDKLSAKKGEMFLPGSILYQGILFNPAMLTQSVLSDPEQIKKSIASEVLPTQANIQSSDDIAVIDARPLLHYGETGEQSAEWFQSIQQLKHALTEVGFLTLTNHGLDASEVKAVSKAYFLQPEDYKRELILTKDCQFGYSVDERLYQTEDNYEGNGQQKFGDPKQSFNMPPPESPLSRWPKTREGFDTQRFQQAFTDYFRDCESFTARFLPNLAYILQVDAEYFDNRMQEHMSVVRSLFYPASETIENLEKEGMRASSHSDFGLLTLLQTFGTPGLQVLNRGGEWITVKTKQPNDLVVNIGDALSRMTNGTFYSTRHRVAHLIKDERQSIPYFVNFASDALVEVVPAYQKSSGNLAPVASGNYIMAKNAKAHGLD